MRTPCRGPGAVLTQTAPGAVRRGRPGDYGEGSGGAEQGATGVEPGDLDVAAPSGFPAILGEDPLHAPRRSALPGEDHRTVRLVAVGPADRRRRGIVVERRAVGLGGTETGEREVQHRGAHL